MNIDRFLIVFIIGWFSLQCMSHEKMVKKKQGVLQRLRDFNLSKSAENVATRHVQFSLPHSSYPIDADLEQQHEIQNLTYEGQRLQSQGEREKIQHLIDTQSHQLEQQRLQQQQEIENLRHNLQAAELRGQKITAEHKLEKATLKNALLVAETQKQKKLDALNEQKRLKKALDEALKKKNAESCRQFISEYFSSPRSLPILILGCYLRLQNIMNFFLDRPEADHITQNYQARLPSLDNNMKEPLWRVMLSPLQPAYQNIRDEAERLGQALNARNFDATEKTEIATKYSRFSGIVDQVEEDLFVFRSFLEEGKKTKPVKTARESSTVASATSVLDVEPPAPGSEETHHLRRKKLTKSKKSQSENTAPLSKALPVSENWSKSDPDLQHLLSVSKEHAHIASAIMRAKGAGSLKKRLEDDFRLIRYTPNLDILHPDVNQLADGSFNKLISEGPLATGEIFEAGKDLYPLLLDLMNSHLGSNTPYGQSGQKYAKELCPKGNTAYGQKKDSASYTESYHLDTEV